MRIEGDGLVLRPWTDDDLAAMAQIFDDQDVARWTPMPSPFGPAQARDRLELARARLATGETVQLAVTTDGRTPLGEVLLFRHVPEPGAPPDELVREVGYAVAAAHRGQGLASRAVRLLGDHAVRVLGVRRLVLRIDAGNVASERVATRCGYVRADRPWPPGGPVVWERVVPGDL